MFSVMFVLIVCHATFAQLPFPETAAKRTDGMQAVTDAERDAKQANIQVWAFVGCFGSVFGVASAYVLTPSVLPIKLLGKSPEYVANYTQTYQQEVRNERTKHAAIGCLGSHCVAVILSAIILPEGGQED